MPMFEGRQSTPSSQTTGRAESAEAGKVGLSALSHRNMADSRRVQIASNECHPDPVPLDQGYSDYSSSFPQRSNVIAFLGPPMLCLGCNGRGYITLPVDPAMVQPVSSTTTAFSLPPAAMTGSPVAVNAPMMQPALSSTIAFSPLPVTVMASTAPGMLEEGNTWCSGYGHSELGM